MLCGDSERRPGKVKCLSHGWVLKDVEARWSHCFQGFRGRGGDPGAARAQAEVKRSRSQGNKHSPRGMPLGATRCAKCCRIESRSQQEDAKGYRGAGWQRKAFGPRQGEGGVWRDAGGLGGCERKGDAGGRPWSSVELEIRWEACVWLRLVPSAWSRAQLLANQRRAQSRSVRLCGCSMRPGFRSCCRWLGGLLFGSPLRAEC